MRQRCLLGNILRCGNTASHPVCRGTAARLVGCGYRGRHRLCHTTGVARSGGRLAVCGTGRDPARRPLLRNPRDDLLVWRSRVRLSDAAQGHPYHRLAEDGENTEHFDRVGVRFVLGALVPLGLGLAGDLYVVLEKVSGSSGLALLGALAVVVGALLLWFALPLVARRRSGGAQ